MKNKGRYRERERQEGGRGECFHWPLECVSNIFRVCSGKSLSLCASAPSFCVRVAAGSQHPAALLPRRGLQLLYTHRAAFCRQARSSTASEAGPKIGQCRDQVVKLQGPGEPALFEGPKTKQRGSAPRTVSWQKSPLGGKGLPNFSRFTLDLCQTRSQHCLVSHFRGVKSLFQTASVTG